MSTPDVVLSPELAVQVKLIERLTKKYDKAKEELEFEKAHLIDICNHPDVEQCKSYFGGSYYDTAYTEYWTKCKICGATSERTIKYHGHYG